MNVFYALWKGLEFSLRSREAIEGLGKGVKLTFQRTNAGFSGKMRVSKTTDRNTSQNLFE